jgi:hypothetical protein
MEIAMNWSHQIEGNWKEIKGKAKQAWGRLTDDELDTIAGKRRADDLSCISTTFNLLSPNDKVCVTSFDDPKVPGGRAFGPQSPCCRLAIV